MNVSSTMLLVGAPVAATLALWWASTGAVLYLDVRDKRTYGWTLGGASALALGALWLAHVLAPQATPLAAGLSFAAGLVCWAWQLVAFYTGYVTGPRKTPCEDDLRGAARFIEAARTSLHHEIVAILGGAALFAVTYDEPNRVAPWTYLVLWTMHESAKLNLYLGVPNRAEDLLPDHLGYLKSFMADRPMNLLFPFSVTGAAVAAFWLAERAMHAASAFEVAAYAMLATLMALAGLEHWFLVAPFDGNALWRFTQRGRKAEAVHPNEAWSLAPPAVCDQRDLRDVLELIAAGAFGDVDRVHGVAKTRGAWVRFDLANGGADIADFAPRDAQQPLVTAVGRGFDRAALQAAFARCAA